MKYKSTEPPIKYLTPWAKKEYLEWYWENEMGCKTYTTDELKARHPEFLIAIKEHHNGIIDFYHSLNEFPWIDMNYLIPYYLMLLIRTGLNPSTIKNLTIDCIEKNPFDNNKEHIDWDKFRSFKSDKTIPLPNEKDDWPVNIVKRVIDITQPIRKNNCKQLWITNTNKYKKTLPVEKSAFTHAINKFSRKHNFKFDISAKEFRPTIAWNEYLRTEDVNYLQILLAHKTMQTTSDYLRRVNDPVFRVRRAIHQEAMFIGLTESQEAKTEFLKNK